MQFTLGPGLLILAVFVAASMVVHFRGRERFRFTRQMSTYTNLLAPVNVLIYALSKVPNKPYHDLANLPELRTLRDNWQVIRDEAMQLYSGQRIKVADGTNDVGFHSFYKRGWKRFYLTWYGKSLPSAEAWCPQTLALLRSVPTVRAAMFALLPPGGRLPSHRDPYAGSLRYHLGLYTPNDDRCKIFVDGQPYSWRDGEDVLFDETFIHTAHNKTTQDRIILFCDVERPLHFGRAFNLWMGRTLGSATLARNVPTEPLGAINRAFGQLYKVRILLKALKVKSKAAYYGLQYLVYGLLVYALVT